jgi:glucose/arabinose dehydrogenase
MLLLAALVLTLLPGCGGSGSGAPSGRGATGTPTPSATTEPTGTGEATATGGWPTIGFEKAWSGLDQPLDLQPVPGTSDLVIAEQSGRLRLVRGGTLLPAPFLDISGRISSGGERGLLGVAFPATFADTGRFYVHYTDPTGDGIIARLTTVRGSATADAKTERIVLRIPHRQYANHNGGQLTFGPDGYLWIGIGDGGGGGNPLGTGQRTDTLLAKLLRIDVEGVDGGAPPDTYRIPPSNPFASGKGGRAEVWAWGLRNPWKFSFDRATGDLYIADVGQNAWEEIDRVANPMASAKPAERNFGWNLWEGDHPYPPGSSPARDGFTFPIAEYGHDGGGASVTGGYVYRGRAYPAMDGLYLFADFETHALRGLRQTGGRFEMRGLGDAGFGISSFGQDQDGELYACDLAGGTVYRVTAR